MNAVTEKPQAVPADAQTTATPQRARLLRRLWRPAAGLVAAIGVAVTASWWFTEGRYIQSTDNAYVQGDIAVLSPRIEGDVAAIKVADNQLVRAGDPLIVLDPADWRARLAQATAAAAEATAAIETAKRQVAQQQATIEAAQAAIVQAQAEQSRASADAARSGSLVANGWASRQSNDQAVADSRKANASVAATQAQKAAAEQQLGVLNAQVIQATARQQSAAAAVQLAENNLAYTVIRAPFDGIAGNRAAELGQHVTPATQLIAVAPLRERLYVVANFKETQLRRMQPGMKVRLIPDIDPNAAVDGRVDSLAPATGALFSLLPPENATGNFTKVVQRVPVKLMLDPAEAAQASWLRAGLSVTAEVDTRGPDAQRLGLFGDRRGHTRARRAMTAATDRLTWRQWVGFMAMVLGMFMAILDIQIVSASISDIQAGLAASPDEASWVQTSYLIAEIVMIPLSGWLSRLLSTRVLFVASALGFTLFSLACAGASSLSEMVMFRAAQGFIGGAMIPTVFATTFLLFSDEKRTQMSVLIGLTATMAPTIGPTLGGWLTDQYSWHWLFLINVPVGALVAGAVWTCLDIDKPDLVAARQLRPDRPDADGAVPRLAAIRAGGRRTLGLVPGRDDRLGRCRFPPSPPCCSSGACWCGAILWWSCAPSPTPTSRSARCSASSSASGCMVRCTWCRCSSAACAATTACRSARRCS